TTLHTEAVIDGVALRAVLGLQQCDLGLETVLLAVLLAQPVHRALRFSRGDLVSALELRYRDQLFLRVAALALEDDLPDPCARAGNDVEMQINLLDIRVSVLVSGDVGAKEPLVMEH